jgi:autotransporter-associated beta strand protein
MKRRSLMADAFSQHASFTACLALQKLRNGCVALIALGLSLSAQAVTYYWDGKSTTANADGGAGPWNTTSNNWDAAATGGAAVSWPSTGTDNKAIFGGTAGTVTNDAGGVTANALAFTTANYTITGGPLALNGTAPSITNAVAATINCDLTGTDGLTKQGAGSLTLSGNNAGLSGTVTISDGSVYCYSNALPSASRLVIASSGNAWFEANGSFTRPLGTSSDGQVDMSQNAGGRIVGLSARGGDLTVNFGGQAETLVWGSTTGFNPSILGLASANATGTLTLENPINLNGTLRTNDVANGAADIDAIMNGIISGTGTSGLVKSGAGTLLLTQKNTYAGGTTFISSQGVVNPLRISNSDALGTGSITFLGSNNDMSVLQLTGNITVTNKFNDWPSRNTAVYANLQNITGTNTVTSNIRTGGGGDSSTLLSDAGLLVLNGSFTGRILKLKGAGDGHIQGGLTMVTAGYGNSIRKFDSGTWTISGVNTYTGMTEIVAGTLQVGNGGTTGNLGSGVVSNGATLVINRSNSYTVSNLIYGAGSLILSGAGTITLVTNNTYTGLTQVNNGTLVLGCNNALTTNNALTLSGGTLNPGSFSNDLSTLTLSTGTASMMPVNTGTCKLSFTGLSGTGTLAITGTVGSQTLRFGTDSTTLTRDQLNLIRANNKKVYLDSKGYLLIIPDGTMIRFF